MELSIVEQKIIEILRDARPFEVVEITKDQLGRLDYYVIKRSQKVVIHKGTINIVDTGK